MFPPRGSTSVSLKRVSLSCAQNTHLRSENIPTRWKYERDCVKPFCLPTYLTWKTEHRVVKHSPVFVSRQSDWGDSKHIPRWRPAGAKHENHVETQTRKSAVTVLKPYPEIRADFRKLPRSRVRSQVGSKFAPISVYLFSVQKQTPASAEIMHAWLIEPHTLRWTQAWSGTLKCSRSVLENLTNCFACRHFRIISSNFLSQEMVKS